MGDTILADAILSGLPLAVLTVDEKHEILHLNSAAEDFFGTSAKHIVGRNVTDLVQFDDARMTAALIDLDANFSAHRADITLRGNDKHRCDFFINTLANSPELRVVTFSPLPKSGQATRGLSMYESGFSLRAPDILAHEIKNPLAAIKGAAQLIGRGLDEEKTSLTQMITSEVERIAKLLDQMQQLSTTQPAKIAAVNIHTLINRARQTIEAGQGDGLKIADSFDPSLPEAPVDADAMMQVLINLLANAVEATASMQNRQITIHTRYSFGASYASGDEKLTQRLPVEIEIADNGPGIADDLVGDIFDPFVTSKNEGQGLGLALVRKLIRDMNGRIFYERDDKAGLTHFRIFLPVADQKGAG